MNTSLIFIIIFVIIILFILVILLLYYTRKQNNNSNYNTQINNSILETNQIPLISSTFEYSVPINILTDCIGLNFSNNDYITTSNGGIKFKKSGQYSFQINFHNKEHDGTNFFIYMMLSTISSNSKSLKYNSVNNQTNGPTYLSVISCNYCSANTYSSKYNKYSQLDYSNSTYNPPLIVTNYQGKCTNLPICDTNYYSFGGIFNVNTDDTYYIQVTFDSSGTYLWGNGTIQLNYNDTYNGIFHINNTLKNYYQNVSDIIVYENPYLSLTSNGSQYNTGFKFNQIGTYLFTFNFYLYYISTSGDFYCWFIIGDTSFTTEQYYTWNNINSATNCPKYLSVDITNFCSAVDNSGLINYYNQYDYDINGIPKSGPPLVANKYQCVGKGGGNVYPNFYTFSTTFVITDINKEYFIQTAIDSSSSSLEGDGNFNFQYLGKSGNNI